MRIRFTGLMALLVLAACGGNVDAPMPFDAGPEASPAPDATPIVDATPDVACPDLEGTACPSGADTCGPCPTQGSEYVCTGNPPTLHKHDCSPGSTDFPCSCGVCPNWQCTSKGYTDTCTNTVDLALSCMLCDRCFYLPPDAAPGSDCGCWQGAWWCAGKQHPDAESCLHCGGHCNSTDASGE